MTVSESKTVTAHEIFNKNNMRRKIRLSVIVVCLLCLSTGLIALASTKATCKHTNAGERRMIEGPWPVSHTVTASQSQGPVTCSGIIWKEKVYYYCPDCGHSVLWDVFTHEKHDVCGMNY